MTQRDHTASGTKSACKKISLLTKQQRFDLMQALALQNPHPQPALKFKNAFELLCAVLLSAQATDESVNKVSPQLFSIAPDATAMAELELEVIEQLIKSIGLWRNKAKHLKSMAQQLVAKFNGQVPSNYADLISLAGVGSKTAKVVLNVAFGQPTVAVDTHIFRVCTRTGFCLGKDALQVEQRIVPLIDQQFLQDAHHYILLHGRYICTARAPHCSECVIAAWCKFKAAKKD